MERNQLGGNRVRGSIARRIAGKVLPGLVEQPARGSVVRMKVPDGILPFQLEEALEWARIFKAREV